MRKGKRQVGGDRFLELVRADVENRFEHAVFRRALDLSVQKQRTKQKPKPKRKPKPYSDQWSFAIDYALHVQDAVREFADLLTQAVIARKKNITREVALSIVDETLNFASRLTSWEHGAGTFVATSLGITGEDPANKVDVTSRSAFEHEVGQVLFNWRIEANNAITLRSFLSARPSTPVTSHDLSKALIARIKGRNPRFSQRQICETLDANEVPLPIKWQRAGDRTWVEAYNNHKTSVKVFLSKIRPSPSNTQSSLRSQLA